MSYNREYKSDVFCMLLEDPMNALSLYNAINGSHYTEPEMVEMKTLDGGVSLSVKNDAAFLIDMNLNFYEHQSSVCGNMPLRNLIYFKTVIDQYIKGKHIYGTKKIILPRPHFIVFYNGKEGMPEYYEQRLSEAFVPGNEEPQLELICKFYNINKGFNEKLKVNCKFLDDYMFLVDRIRDEQIKNQGKTEDEMMEIIESVVDFCILNNKLKGFLINRREEVLKMYKLDLTYETHEKFLREELREELRPKLREELRPEVKAEVMEEVMEEVKAEVMKEVKAEVKEKVKAEVKAEAMMEARADIIRNLLDHKLTKEQILEFGYTKEEIDAAGFVSEN
ncbi:MAG: hypothetical protein MJ113_02760 [Lachnospiraceae bacterium]|nr:hypothetical protein [Lachnospiraceae bacterium]